MRRTKQQIEFDNFLKELLTTDKLKEEYKKTQQQAFNLGSGIVQYSCDNGVVQFKAVDLTKVYKNEKNKKTN